MILYGTDQIGKTLETEVCIVGSGPAGITLAWYLLKKGIKVTILEGSRVYNPNGPNAPIPSPGGNSQSFKYNENLQLYNGVSNGEFCFYETDFLTLPNPNPYNKASERDRIYGGTSTHWGGQSRPINPSTFEARPGFPGWPVSRKDLDPYYEETCKFLGYYGPYYKDGIAGYNFTAEFWAEQLGCSELKFDMKGFEIQMYQGIPPQNLQFQAMKVNFEDTGDGKTIGDSDATVILNASLLQIDSQAGSVNKLTVGVLGGTKDNPTYDDSQQFTITAQAYVLACGAVANARQLLLSDIGNEYDQVGRYLSAQPLAQNLHPGAITTSTAYFDNFPCASKLVKFNNDPDINSKFGLSFLIGELTPIAETLNSTGLGSCWFGKGGTGNYYHELLPERESRITLTDYLDIFKQRQTRATWVLSPEEEENYYGLANLFEEGVHSIKKQDVKVTDWNTVIKNLVINGHHLCTTRMSGNPECGVVDKNLRVHSMNNLYCAGSSVWTTAGIVNPTFSIVAFSIRLAEHLADKIN